MLLTIIQERVKRVRKPLQLHYVQGTASEASGRNVILTPQSMSRAVKLPSLAWREGLVIQQFTINRR